jgi:hypothetical protein
MSGLSEARKRLVLLMQQLNFARVEGLVVRDGEPVLDPLPRIVREHKFSGENGPRPEALLADFVLKPQLLDLFREVEELGDGTIDVLTIKHGLPFNCEIAA